MSETEKPAGTVPGVNCGAQVSLANGMWATCTDHGLGHYDTQLHLSWPDSPGRLVTVGAPAAGRGDTDDSGERIARGTAIAMQTYEAGYEAGYAAALASPAARPTEPPGELREQIARALYERDGAAEFTTWAQLPDWNRRMWLSDADALLSGPVAPLLAKLQAVQSVLDEAEQVMEPGGIALVVTARVRRALDGPQ